MPWSTTWVVPTDGGDVVRFLAGLVAGLVVTAAGYFGYREYGKPSAECGGYCGAHTRCEQGLCVAELRPTKRVRRRSKRLRRRKAVSPSASQALKPASAADRQPVAKGPPLRQVDYVEMGTSGNTRVLSTEEIAARFRRLDRRIVGCIEQARSGYAISGRVVVEFRIDRSGKVDGVRLTAPDLLQRNDLYGCVRPLVSNLTFPQSSRAMTASFPYDFD